ncbi:MAG TPA: MOSC domain-containing protein [Candidatus Dormibacteraeota bacterium]|nr:MOSC domain-containing protein [Candidatus Dormibacteraeota bacterium]
MGTVEHIHIARLRSGPTEAVPAIDLVRGAGIIGDRNEIKAGEWDESHIGEELTLVEAEALERLAREHDIHLEPGDTRRNVTTRGVSLNALLGRRFRVGEVIAEGVELCEPCTHLQSMLGKPIVRPLVHRAGLRALLVNSGRVRVGDVVEDLGPAQLIDAVAAEPDLVER